MWGLTHLYPLWYLILWGFKIFADCRWHLSVILIHISLSVNEFEYFFIWIVPICFSGRSMLSVYVFCQFMEILGVLYIFFSFIFISWRLIFLQYCSVFCHTLTWISHGFTYIPHPTFHLPLYPIPLGFPSAPGSSTCLMHPTEWSKPER